MKVDFYATGLPDEAASRILEIVRTEGKLRRWIAEPDHDTEPVWLITDPKDAA